MPLLRYTGEHQPVGVYDVKDADAETLIAQDCWEPANSPKTRQKKEEVKHAPVPRG